MAYVIVFLVALLAGASVYWLTLRAGRAEPIDAAIEGGGGGFLPDPPDTSGGYSYASSYAASLQERRTYVPVGADRRSWQTRAVGVLGLLIAVTLAAALLAFSLYQVGSLVAKLVNDYAS